MRSIKPDPFDLLARHKHVNIDCPAAFKRHRIKFLVLEDHVMVLSPLIPPDFIISPTALPVSEST